MDLCRSSRRSVCMMSESPQVTKLQCPTRLPPPSTRPRDPSHVTYRCTTAPIVGAASTWSWEMEVSRMEKSVRAGLSVGRTKVSKDDTARASWVAPGGGASVRSGGRPPCVTPRRSGATLPLRTSRSWRATDGNWVISATGSILLLSSAVHSKSRTIRWSIAGGGASSARLRRLWLWCADVQRRSQEMVPGGTEVASAVGAGPLSADAFSVRGTKGPSVCGTEGPSVRPAASSGRQRGEPQILQARKFFSREPSWTKVQVPQIHASPARSALPPRVEGAFQNCSRAFARPPSPRSICARAVSCR
mmetsp:Transcript_20251/g.40407  ORF Transcript_20251/g.40407 Transcript_20251/m.40407 type:complete len:304 (-) Transcript_20251:124-1035(-)